MSDDTTALGFLRGLRIAAIAITAALMAGLSLPILLSHLGDYPSVRSQVGGYLVVVLIVVLDAVLIYRSRFWGPWRWPVAVIALAVSVASQLDLSPDDQWPVGNWAFEQIGWLGFWSCSISRWRCCLPSSPCTSCSAAPSCSLWIIFTRCPPSVW